MGISRNDGSVFVIACNFSLKGGGSGRGDTTEPGKTRENHRVLSLTGSPTPFYIGIMKKKMKTTGLRCYIEIIGCI